MKKSAALAMSASANALWQTSTMAEQTSKQPLFHISLAQWSLHKMLFDEKLDNLDFAKYAQEEFEIDAVEYVNQFFKDKAQDRRYLKDIQDRAVSNGVQILLIMCDGEGNLGDPDDKRRKGAIESHYKWVEAAKVLGCHSIRVNAASSGSFDEQAKLATDGLRRLSEFGATHDINVIVENHGGLSSNGKWLSQVIHSVNLPNCGTLPDFGNFTEYDRYLGVQELMPFAKAVSAKSHSFDETGNETKTDYEKMMGIVLNADYHGYVGIEYEGSRLSEPEGIKATLRLLKRIRKQWS